MNTEDTKKLIISNKLEEVLGELEIITKSTTNIELIPSHEGKDRKCEKALPLN